MNGMDNFGKNLRVVRKKHKLSQQEVADYCGITLRAYSAWELRGAIPRNKERLAKLEELFGDDAYILYEGERSADIIYELNIKKLFKLKEYHKKCIKDIDAMIAMLSDLSDDLD